MPSRREIRTSESHPIYVNWVETSAPWRLGITIAPGKHDDAREGFRWERSLAADLDALVALGAGTLVCLLETHEMARLGISDLLTTARARGLEVVHLPIVDVSLPSTKEARDLVADLQERRDRPIVVHCNGGLGRSGVIAGCFLRALGIDADEALRRLRAARGPECPQTDDQRAFVGAFSR